MGQYSGFLGVYPGAQLSRARRRLAKAVASAAAPDAARRRYREAVERLTEPVHTDGNLGYLKDTFAESACCASSQSITALGPPRASPPAAGITTRKTYAKVTSRQ